MRFVTSTTATRTGRALVLSLALLAIVAALAFVAHDVSHRLPFWWSSEDALAHIEFRLGLPGADPTAELRDLPVHDRRGIDVLVKCLASPDGEIRWAARHAVHEHLDRWQLADSVRGLWLTEQLIQALLQQAAHGNREFQLEATELAQRVLQPARNGPAGHSDSFVDHCERLIRRRVATEGREVVSANESLGQLPEADQQSAIRPGRWTRGESFEDHFALPGGRLPVTTSPSAVEQIPIARD